MMRALLARELRLAWRSGAEILNPLWFFLIVITLFPFGVGAAPQLLAQIAPGVVWVAALLAALLVMDRLFRDDWQDGSLEQLMLLPTPLVAVVLVKVVAHWMMSGLPLLIVSPLAALLLGMSLHDAGVLALTLLLGTPTLSFSARWGWPDGRPEARRRPAEPAGAAAGGAAADFRHRGLPGGGRRAPGQRLSGDAGGVLNRQRHPVSVRHRRCAAADRAITRCACGRGHHNRVSKRLCGKRYINWRSPSGCTACADAGSLAGGVERAVAGHRPGVGLWLRPADYQQGKATGSCTFTFRRRCGRWGCTWRWPSRPSSGWSGRSKWPIWRSPPWRRWGGLHPGGAGQRRGMGQADVGTWWIWDARLTSELVLLFLYAGVIALWHAFDDRRLAGRAAGILVLVGVVNLPIIHYSVYWWNTLHQGSTNLQQTIDPSMRLPLRICIFAFLTLSVTLTLMRLRNLILQLERRRPWVVALVNKGAAR